MHTLTFLAIACGGAIGAALRHGINLLAAHFFGTGFPWGTLAVNIAGSFLMGVLIAVFAEIWNPSQTVRAFLTVGFLGGLTTFSSFSLDAVTLYERQEYTESAAYLAASVVLSIGALLAGMHLTRGLAS